MQIEEPLADWRNVCRSKKSLICRFKRYLLIEELSADRSVIFGSVDWITICRLQKFLQIEEPFPDRRIVCRPNDYSIGRLENDLQIKYSICRSNKHLWIEELSADRSLICRLKNYLQIEELFVDHRIVYISRKYLICKLKKDPWMEELSYW